MLLGNKLKIILLYLFFSIVFIGTSFFMAYYFWWRIDDGSSQFFIIVFSAMICWVGIGYLSTLISSKIIFKNIEEIGFVSPFTLVFKGYFYATKGLQTAKKFKAIFSILAFPLLIFAIFSFYKIINFTERTDLNCYRIERQIKIDKISYYKGSKRAHIYFEYGGNKINKIIYLNDTLKNTGDYETIIFSSRNPYIAKSKMEYEKNIK